MLGRPPKCGTGSFDIFQKWFYFIINIKYFKLYSLLI
jgi:hypothetical protein